MANEPIPYYDTQPAWSRNGVWNFVVGARGLGKTFGFKRDAIKRAIERGEQFILLRRFQTELSTRMSFFDDVGFLFPDYDFRVHGMFAQMAHIDSRDDRKRPWATIGFFVALTGAQKHKGTSYHKVTTIIFDEFIIERGYNQYLPDEVTVFTNFFSTVDRNKDKTRAFFLANSVSIMNPYFIEYKVRPDESKNGWVTRRDGFIVVHFPDSKAFSTAVYSSRFGQFIKDSEYADYAVENTFEDNNDWLLNIKDVKARYQYTLETKVGVFSVWYSTMQKTYFVQKQRPKLEKIYTLIPSKMRDGKTLLTTRERLLVLARAAFKNGSMYFDEPETRNAFIEVFK